MTKTDPAVAALHFPPQNSQHLLSLRAITDPTGGYSATDLRGRYLHREVVSALPEQKAQRVCPAPLKAEAQSTQRWFYATKRSRGSIGRVLGQGAAADNSEIFLGIDV
jgi:hypothetical protein